jgi:hypothetical protein
MSAFAGLKAASDFSAFGSRPEGFTCEALLPAQNLPSKSAMTGTSAAQQ